MLLKFLGWFWIMIGLLFLLHTEKIRSFLKKRKIYNLKIWSASLAFILGVLLVNTTWGMKGILSRTLLFFGFICFLKGIFMLKVKSADKIIVWMLGLPIKFLRIWAVLGVLFGAVILSV